MNAEMPVEVVEQGTTPRQRVVTGSVATIADIVSEAEIKAPAIIIVGKVVGLHKQLSWFNPGQ